MKKITTALIVMLCFGLFSNLSLAQTKKILYLNQIGVSPESGSGASTPGYDPVIRMLRSDPNFVVTYIETDQDGTAIPDLAGFDLVIAQETMSSGAGVFRPDGKLGIKDVTIPIIYNKTWAFRNGKAVTDADATVTGTQNLFVSVDPSNHTHALFSGIDFSSGNDIKIFNEATANDAGTAGGGNKAIDVLNNLDISTAGTLLASVPEVTDADKAFVVNYLPSGTQLGESTADVLNVDAVALSFSYGATVMGNGTNITNEALTIWRNAAYTLTGLTAPAELYEPAPMRILYVNQIGVSPESGSGASLPGYDPVIRMLKADPNFNVTYVETDQDGTALPELSNYDLVIAQETMSSGAAVFRPDGKLGVKDVTIPIIYNKTWAFRNGKAVTDADATVTGTQNLSITVNESNQNHAMFSGIDFTAGNDIKIFNEATANDAGTQGGGNKAIDVLNNLDISNGGTLLATVPEVTDPAKAFVVNYLPAGTQLGESETDVLNVHAVAFSFSYGASVMGNGTNISNEALTIWRNAAYTLTGLTAPTEVYQPMPMKILYVNQVGVEPKTDSGASAAGNDAIIRMFNSDDNFELTYVETPQDGSELPDLNEFSLVIVQETVSSGAAMLKPDGVLGIKNVSIPVIYNKTWAFRNDKAVTDADATVTATQNLSVTVTNPEHALFNGIDFTGGNDIPVFFEATANDAGTQGAGNKAIDVLNNLDISNTGTLLATVPEVTDAAKAFVINYLPSGTQLGENEEDILNVHAVSLSFSYGATAMLDGANISSEALTIWRNSAYLLTGLTVPNTLFENQALSIEDEDILEKHISTYPNPTRDIVNLKISGTLQDTKLSLYNLTGQRVWQAEAELGNNNSFSIDLQSFGSGIYLLNVKRGNSNKTFKIIKQ